MFIQCYIKILRDYKEKGIYLRPVMFYNKTQYEIILPLFQNDKNLIQFLSQIKDLNIVNILQELWLEGIVFEGPDRQYYIPYNSLYEIEKNKSDILLLPREEEVTVKINSFGAVGHPNFRLIYSIFHNDYGEINFDIAKKYNNVIILPDYSFVLPQKDYRVIQEIDEYKQTDDFNEQTKFLAKIKKRAQTANAEVDQYIKNEQYYFPEELDIYINKKNDDELELIPYFKDINNSDINLKLNNEMDLTERISFKNGNKRERVFIESDILKDYKKINKNKKIMGTDVPRFVENPYTYIPESISIEDFSKRVKELGIVVYRAQPFIRSNRLSKNNWFDYETGIELKPDGMSHAQHHSISDEEFSKLVEDAKENGDEYVYHNDKWIKVNYDSGREYLNKSKIIKQEFPDKQFNIARLPYILKIFENIDSLEYNETILEEKYKLINMGLLKYKKPYFIREDVNLKDYQEEGFIWIRLLMQQKLGGILADDMGLGKTVQVITYMAFLKEKSNLKPALVVAPYTLIYNWKREISKFTKGINNIYIHLGQRRIQDLEIIKRKDIVLTTYETLVRDQLLLGQIDWTLVACDEAQKIKNTTAYATGVAKALKAGLKLAVTGTPVENGLNELWCIADFVQPGLLRSYEEFRKKYEIPIQKENIDNKQLEELKMELRKRISPIYLRRTKEDKLRGLPKKKDIKKYLPIGLRQNVLYSKIINKYINKEMKFLTALMELMKLCNHPALVDESLDITNKQSLLKESTKLIETVNILKTIKERGEKALIFTRFLKMQDILSNIISQIFGFCPLRINGKIKNDRLGVISNFENVPNFNVMILSPKAAGLGLTITKANHVIHYTREWNPAIESQATDRAYRIGQEKDVFVYYPICTSKNGETVEEKLDKLLEEKKKLFKDIIISSDKIKLQEDDFKNVFNDWLK